MMNIIGFEADWLGTGAYVVLRTSSCIVSYLVTGQGLVQPEIEGAEPTRNKPSSY